MRQAVERNAGVAVAHHQNARHQFRRSVADEGADRRMIDQRAPQRGQQGVHGVGQIGGAELFITLLAQRLHRRHRRFQEGARVELRLAMAAFQRAETAQFTLHRHADHVGDLVTAPVTAVL